MTSEQEFTSAWALASQLQSAGWDIVSKSKDGSNWFLAKHTSHPDIALEKYTDSDRCGVVIQMDSVVLHGALASLENKMQHAKRLLDVTDADISGRYYLVVDWLDGPSQINMGLFAGHISYTVLAIMPIHFLEIEIEKLFCWQTH